MSRNQSSSPLRSESNINMSVPVETSQLSNTYQIITPDTESLLEDHDLRSTAETRLSQTDRQYVSVQNAAQSSTQPNQSSHSQRNSNRSHSRSPQRHRHSHRHHSHRRRSRFRFKEKERNFLAAVCSMIVIVTLSTALAEPNWFYMRGGGCRSNDDDNSQLHTLGVYQFFYVGHFSDSSAKPSHAPRLVYHYSGDDSNDVLINCVTPRMVMVLRSMIALCFVGIVFSLIAFLLDLAGPSDRMMKTLRRNAVFNILTVVVCVVVNGFSLLITQLLETLQVRTKQHRYAKVDIRFDVSFYLVAVAGGMSVIAASFNLLRRYPPYDPSAAQRDGLLDDYDGLDAGPDLYPGLHLLITQLLETLEVRTKQHRYAKVDISFDVSFYLVAVVGGMSVIAASFNLLRHYDTSASQRDDLLDDYDGLDAGPDLYPGLQSHVNFLGGRLREPFAEEVSPIAALPGGYHTATYRSKLRR